MTTQAATVSYVGHPRSYGGILGWLATVDHKRIGVLYGVSAILFLMVGGLEALVIRLQLSSANASLVGPETFNALFTMHALTMIFLGVMPFGAAFFNFIVPLQIGARDVAFPRLNALSYWVFLFGGLLLNAGWLVGALPSAGWFAYVPLSAREYSPGMGMDIYLLGLLVLGVSSLAAAFNFIVTILNMRAPGMGLMRMPPFTWMVLVTTFLLIFAFPILTVGLVELLFQRYFDMPFFNPGQGGDPLLWQHIFWIFGHPEVYILILPAMGIVSEVLPTFSRKPLFGYPVVVFSGVAIAFMGFAVWSHHMFTVGLGPVANAVFSASTMIIAIPTGVKVFNWLATIWGGSISLKTPFYFAVGFVALFIIGGLSGMMHASPPIDTQQQDTYFVVAHLHYVLFGGSIFGLFAGAYYWWPKVTGRMMGEGLGQLHFWLFFLGMNLTFGPMHIVGLLGMPRRVYTYPEGMGWELLNQMETVGAFVMALGLLVFIYNAARSLRSGERAGPDPWDGRTLEWTTDSPPAPYNFAVIPVVRGREPLWDSKHPHVEPGRVAAVAGGSNGHGNGPAERIHMPNASFWPLVVSFGIGLGGGLVLVHPALGAVGAVIAMVGIYAWAFEPAAPSEHEAEEVHP